MASWLIAVLCLGACAVGLGFVASVEVAVSGLPKARIDRAIRDGLTGAHGLSYLLTHTARVWATIHLLRVFFLIGAGVAALVLAQESPWYIPEVLVAVWAAVSFWVLAVLVPRMLVKRRAVTWARLTVYSVRFLALVLRPLIWPLNMVGRAATALLGGARSAFWTQDELAEAAARARSESLGRSDEDLLDSIIKFSDTVIREIMVPRTEMVALSLDATAEEVRRVVVERGHSRLPVYEDTIDNIIGLLHVKDLFRQSNTPGAEKGGDLPLDAVVDGLTALRGLLRPAFYVPEVMKISELLREFQRRKTHMAIVVDEYGGTAGVVTLEDIIEEIVGEIQDEYDVEEKQYRVLSVNKLIADGRVTVYDLEDVLDVQFPEDSGFETLAGFLMFRAGCLPEPGAVIEWNDLRFTVKEANEKRIATVEIERRVAEGPPDGPASTFGA